MKDKINISELLKDCLQGMELDCVMYEDVYFDHVDELNIIHCYIQNEGFKTSITFNQHGTPHSDAKSKCVIFPKGKNTWEGFHRPFRDGDIITCNNSACTFVSIFKDKPTERSFRKHCSFILDYNRFVVTTKFADYTNPRFATEEEKAKLFQAIKDNGYKWNAETNTLEELLKFKDGDVVVDDYGNIHLLRTEDSSYCAYRHIRKNKLDSIITTNITVVRLATEEEKEKLFDAIKENGYRWNTETKTLEKLVEPTPKPCFKSGDTIRHKKNKAIIKTIGYLDKDNYVLYNGHILFFSEQDQYELIPNKFDISKLKPFDEVLVRDFDSEVWEIDFFSKLLDGKHFKCHGSSYVQCIPYKGNEHLHNTTNTCPPFYKTWEK